MAEGQRRNTVLVPQAAQALDRFKQEVASELGIQNYQGYLGDLPSRLNGAVGGHMVRRMIAAAEQSLIEQATQQVRAGFQQGFQSAAQSQSTNPRTVQTQTLHPQNV